MRGTKQKADQHPRVLIPRCSPSPWPDLPFSPSFSLSLLFFSSSSSFFLCTPSSLLYTHPPSSFLLTAPFHSLFTPPSFLPSDAAVALSLTTTITVAVTTHNTQSSPSSLPVHIRALLSSPPHSHPNQPYHIFKFQLPNPNHPSINFNSSSLQITNPPSSLTSLFQIRSSSLHRCPIHTQPPQTRVRLEPSHREHHHHYRPRRRLHLQITITTAGLLQPATSIPAGFPNLQQPVPCHRRSRRHHLQPAPFSRRCRQSSTRATCTAHP